MASKRPSGHHTTNDKTPVEEADTLTHVVAKLSVLCDFFKHPGGDSLQLDGDTIFGMYLIMGDCIDALKKLGGVAKEE